ncbi:hypothetical protein [Amycolatopsis sp. lyj-84]|uniref:hypothetical protein n=1 Tax=Amycolatopsis sp. lyj-84 TaxID=2789284 RepID=UPI0039787906
MWHARDRLINELPDQLRHWAVRLNTNTEGGGRSEWLHEREWRVPTSALQLQRGPLIGLLVGDPNWRPETRRIPRELWFDGDGNHVAPGDHEGQPALVGFDELPWLWENLPRRWWNPATGSVEPTPDRAQIAH